MSLSAQYLTSIHLLKMYNSERIKSLVLSRNPFKQENKEYGLLLLAATPVIGSMCSSAIRRHEPDNYFQRQIQDQQNKLF